MPQLSLQFSGTFSAAVGDKRISKFRSDKARAMLAYLALEADVAHRRDALALLFWESSSDSAARANIRNTLSNLKQLLAAVPAVLTITRQTVTFNSAESQIDVVAFAQNPHLHLDSYRGEFLSGLNVNDALGFEEWRMMQQERLHLLAMTTLDDMQQAALAQNKLVPLGDLARQQLFLESWHEPAHRNLLRALVGQGQMQAASEQYERCRAILLQEFGAEPAQATQALWRQLQAQGAPESPAASTPAPNNLPQALPPFFGRKQALAHIDKLFATRRYRLLTITGLGGSGKTRLALEVAQAQLSRFSDGVWFVPLADIVAADALPSTIASALGIELAGDLPPQQQLQQRLHAQNALIILDNLEQLPESVADIINDLLQATENLHVITTSRRRLNLRIETLVPLIGLPIPAEGEPAAQADSPALALFCEQLARLNPFDAAQEDTPTMAEICRLVDGLPLGIELAAAQLEQRPLTEIADVLRHTLNELQTSMRDVPARQRSLRAVFESSWVLLTAVEQQGLAQLSVFRGGFDLAAATAIVEGASTELLASLQTHSLLQLNSNNRYSLHPLVQEFSAEKQTLIATQNSHSHYYLTTARRFEDSWYGLDFAATQQRAHGDWANFNAAWRHGLALPNWPLLEQATAAMRSLYRFTVRYHEGAALFAAAYAQLAPQAATAEQRLVLGKVQAAAAWFLVQLHDHESAEFAITRALAYADSSNSPQLALDVQLSQQVLLTQQDKLELSLALSESVITLAQQQNMPQMVARAQLDAGFVHMLKGHFAEGRAILQRAEATFQQAGNVLDALTALRNIGIANMMLRELDSAESNMLAALDLARQRQDREREIFVIDTLGSLYYQGGELGRAIDAWCERLVYAREQNLQADIAACLSNLGLAYGRLGQFELATKTLQEALPLIAAQESNANLCSTYITLSGLLKDQQRVDDAINTGQRAVALALAHGLTMFEGNARGLLGSIYLSDGQLDAAAKQLQLALVIREEMNAVGKAAECRAQLALVAVARGNSAEARQQVEQVLADQAYLKSGNPHWVLHDCYRILNALGDARANNLLCEAQVILTSRAERITDPAQRDAYLNSVPQHLTILTDIALG